MASRLLSHKVSDICIGKPAARALPPSSTVGDALHDLKRSGELCLGVWSAADAPPKHNHQRFGRISIADIICYLCAEENIADPAAALGRSLVDFLHDSAGFVFLAEPEISLLEAMDRIRDGAHGLVVPLQPSVSRRRLVGTASTDQFCWLIQEDFVRFFLDSMPLFSPIPYLSISELGIVRSDVLAVHPRDPALSAAPLLRRALAEHSSVAVTTDDGHLFGEITPSSLCRFEDAAALAVLSVEEFMTRGGCMRAVKARLREKGLRGILEMLVSSSSSPEAYSSSTSSSSSSTSASGSSSSSSSSDEAEAEATCERRRTRLGRRKGSCSARVGSRSEEAEVCRPESSLAAVMLQALCRRVSNVWVVDEENDGVLVGVVTVSDVVQVFYQQLSLCRQPG